MLLYENSSLELNFNILYNNVPNIYMNNMFMAMNVTDNEMKLKDAVHVCMWYIVVNNVNMKICYYYFWIMSIFIKCDDDKFVS